MLYFNSADSLLTMKYSAFIYSYFGRGLIKNKRFIIILVVLLIILLWKSRLVGSGTRLVDVENIKSVLDVAELSGVDLILLHPQTAYDINKVERFSTNQPAIFGLPIRSIHILKEFVNDLEENGFLAHKFICHDDQPSHLFLLKNNSPLHIILLHWKDAGYWKQFSLQGTTSDVWLVKEYITLEQWNILSVDRAFESFETVKSSVDSIEVVVPKNYQSFTRDLQGSKFIECNYTQSKMYFSKYPKSMTESAKSFRHKAWKLLSKAKTILDQLEIPFWLSSGTCLGYYRQCDFMEWSQDIDLGIFIENHQGALVEHFAQAGLPLVHQFGRIDDSFELSFRDTLKLDIFFFYSQGSTFWNGGTQARTGKKFKYIFPSFTLCWTEFLDLKVRIPCQTESYITANYGPRWAIPSRSWDWKTSPHNVQENGYWKPEEMKEVVILKQP